MTFDTYSLVLLRKGPAWDDPSLRGLCLYATSVEEARALANADPRVQAGQLVVEAMRFHTKEGALAFPLER